MSRKRADSDTSRTAAAVLGAPIAALLFGVALARVLPLSEGTAFAWKMHLIFPVWIGLAVALPLTRTGRRAWTICLCIGLPAAAVLWLGRDTPPSEMPPAGSAP